MQPLNFIARYYGEKFGFYFAWLVNYTAWLAPLAIIGVIFFILQVVTAMNKMTEAEAAYDCCVEDRGQVSEDKMDEIATECLIKHPTPGANPGMLDN